MHLRLYFLPAPVLTHIRSIDFIIEVADVTNDCTFLQALKHRAITDIDVASCGNEYVSIFKQTRIDVFGLTCLHAILIWADNFKSVHTSLHRTDWVRFCDTHDHAFLTKALC